MKKIYEIVFPIDTIEITDEDIEKALSSCGKDSYDARCDCPIGNAIRRTFKLRRDDISVDGEIIRIRDVIFVANKAIAKFIEKFDDNLVVKPFQFQLSKLKFYND